MYRLDSSNYPQHYKHYRFNCASSFESLASHLTDIMYYQDQPNKNEAVKWVNNCIKAREKDHQRPDGIDISHKIVIVILKRLSHCISTIPPGMRATIEFVNERGNYRFWVQLEDGQVATVDNRGIWLNEFAFGGRKSTRKNRKRNRKTYRILPRVEGS